MATDEEFEQFWAEERKKKAKLIKEMFSGDDIPDERCELPETKPRFPEWTYEELAYYQPDGSILIMASNNDPKTGRGGHGSRVYKPDNPNYQKVFEGHRFNERTNDSHWIVELNGKIIGEGWGSDDSK